MEDASAASGIRAGVSRIETIVHYTIASCFGCSPQGTTPQTSSEIPNHRAGPEAPSGSPIISDCRALGTYPRAKPLRCQAEAQQYHITVFRALALSPNPRSLELSTISDRRVPGPHPEAQPPRDSRGSSTIAHRRDLGTPPIYDGHTSSRAGDK